MVVEERGVGGIAAGRDPHQAMAWGEPGRVDHHPLTVDDRLGDGVAVTVGSAQAAGAPTPPAGAPAQPVTGG